MALIKTILFVATLIFTPILELAAQEGHTLIGIGKDSATWGVEEQEPKENPVARSTGILSVSARRGSLIIDSESRLWGVGYWCISEPIAEEPLLIAEDVRNASCGENHCLFVKNDNTLWAIGAGWLGALGLGEFVYSADEPTQVASDVLSASAGYQHSLFVKTDNSLWGMGYGGQGELRGEGLNGAFNPVPIANNVTAAAAGWNQTLYITSDQVLCELGASVRDWGSAVFQPRAIANDVSSVSIGDGFTLFIKEDATLWGIGSNNSGQLGAGDKSWYLDPIEIAADVSNVSAGPTHSLIIKTDKTAWGMGKNINGQLGSESFTNIRMPIFIGNGAYAVAAGLTHSLILSDTSLTEDNDSDGYSLFNDPDDNDSFKPFVDLDGNFVPDNFIGEYIHRDYSPALKNPNINSQSAFADLVLAPGTSYTIEISADLKDWQPTQIALSTSESELSFSYDSPEVVANVKLGDSSLFYRLVATRE